MSERELIPHSIRVVTVKRHTEWNRNRRISSTLRRAQVHNFENQQLLAIAVSACSTNDTVTGRALLLRKRRIVERTQA